MSGVAPDRVQHVLGQDWTHIIRRKVLDSPVYLREQSRPVVAVRGFGVSDPYHSPAMVRAIARSVRGNTPGGAYIIASVPAHWRAGVQDADTESKVWLEGFDALMPWTVGDFSSEGEADQFEQDTIKGDGVWHIRRGPKGGRTVQIRKIETTNIAVQSHVPRMRGITCGICISEGNLGAFVDFNSA